MSNTYFVSESTPCEVPRKLDALPIFNELNSRAENYQRLQSLEQRADALKGHQRVTRILACFPIPYGRRSLLGISNKDSLSEQIPL